MCVCVCLSACLRLCLCTCLCTYQDACLIFCLSVPFLPLCHCVLLSACLPLCPNLSMSVCVSGFLPACLPVHLCVCGFVCPNPCLTVCTHAHMCRVPLCCACVFASHRCISECVLHRRFSPACVCVSVMFVAEWCPFFSSWDPSSCRVEPHHWSGIWYKDRQCGWEADQAADLGHCRARTLPVGFFSFLPFFSFPLLLWKVDVLLCFFFFFGGGVSLAVVATVFSSCFSFAVVFCADR